ncbi:hypothetical protein BDZ88DRAFT_438122 [Geranomyces variabilis]|nr:hypothetical protein BDZ88DRAFT_438122 [Geranomyces variabilis]KAJ3137090.1 hypothetical protein HDU90_002261 [Geranomyces variabilis]
MAAVPTSAPANCEVVDLTFDDADDLLAPASKLHLSPTADESNSANNAIALRTRSRAPLVATASKSRPRSARSHTTASATPAVGSPEHMAVLAELRAAREERDDKRSRSRVKPGTLEKKTKKEDARLQLAQVDVAFALKQLAKRGHQNWKRRLDQLDQVESYKVPTTARKIRQKMPANDMVRLSIGGRVVNAPPVARVLSVHEAVSLVNGAQQRAARAADLMTIDGGSELSAEVIVIDDDDDDDGDASSSGSASTVPPLAVLADRTDTQPISSNFASRPDSNVTSDAVPSSPPESRTVMDALKGHSCTNEMSPSAPVIISPEKMINVTNAQAPPSPDPDFISINDIAYDGLAYGRRLKEKGSERFIRFSDDPSALASLGSRKDRPSVWEVISPNFAPSGNVWLAKPGDALTTASTTIPNPPILEHLLAKHPPPSLPSGGTNLLAPPNYDDAPIMLTSITIEPLRATHPLPALPPSGSSWSRGETWPLPREELHSDSPTSPSSTTMKHWHDTALHNMCFGSHSMPRQPRHQQYSCWPFDGPPETWAQPGMEFNPLDDEPYYDPRRGQRVYANPGL